MSLTALLLFALFCAPAAHAQRLHFVSGNSQPVGGDEKHPGFADRVAREAFRRIGMEIEVSLLPAERVLLNVNSGLDDGDLLRIAGMEKEYPNLVMVPEKMMDSDFVAFTVDQNIRFSGFAGLKPYAVAHVRGWKIYEQNVKEFRELMTVRGLDELFTLLKNNRAEVVLAERWQGLWAARQVGVHALVVEPPFARVERFMYLNKRHAALVPRVAKALADMKADGTYERIVDATLRPLERQ